MDRSNSVDTARLFAIAAVIMIHTQPFSGAAASLRIYSYPYLLVNQLARFAVPMFFVLAGYFWGLKIRGGHSMRRSQFRRCEDLASSSSFGPPSMHFRTNWSFRATRVQTPL